MYGPEYEDISYFSDFAKGYAALERERRRMKEKSDKEITTLMLMLIEYKNDDDGVYKERELWKIDYYKRDFEIVQTTPDAEWGS